MRFVCMRGTLAPQVRDVEFYVRKTRKTNSVRKKYGASASQELGMLVFVSLEAFKQNSKTMAQSSYFCSSCTVFSIMHNGTSSQHLSSASSFKCIPFITTVVIMSQSDSTKRDCRSILLLPSCCECNETRHAAPPKLDQRQSPSLVSVNNNIPIIPTSALDLLKRHLQHDDQHLVSLFSCLIQQQRYHHHYA